MLPVPFPVFKSKDLNILDLVENVWIE